MPFVPWKPGQSGNPAGRERRTLTKQDLAVIKALAARGVREPDIARGVGMSPPTWTKIKRDFPEAQEALDAGRQMMHDALIGKLFEKAMKGDIAALIFTLKSRFGYREGDEASERPQVIIHLPGAASAEQYAKGVTVEQAKPMPLVEDLLRG